jgi:hypothetical protein
MIQSMAPTVCVWERAIFLWCKGPTGIPVQIVRVTSASHNRKIISQLLIKNPDSIEKTSETLVSS